MKLIDNLYCYIWEGMGNNCHSYLFRDVLTGKRPHVIIDPGYTASGLGEDCLGILTQAIKRDGINPEDIGLILNTHSHPDHCEANQALIETGLEAIPDAKPASVAITGNEIAFQNEMGKRFGNSGLIVQIKPDFLLEEGPLSLGEGDKQLNLEVIFTPGHSPGSASFYWPERKVLITGDTVFHGSIGRTDFPGGDSRLIKQSIQRLAGLDSEYLLPGHNTDFGNILEGKQGVERNFDFIRRHIFPLL